MGGYSACNRVTRDEFADLEGKIVYFLGVKLCWQSVAGRGLLRHLGEFVGKGINNQLEAVGYTELRIDRTEVMCDSCLADKEPFGDLFVLQAL